MSTRLNWRLLIGELVVIVVGVLVALWVDQVREASVNAGLELRYLESLLIDLDSDLAQFDSTEAWMRRQESAAATVLSLYDGAPSTEDPPVLVAAVESAGWQYFPSITRKQYDARVANVLSARLDEWLRAAA